MLLSAEKARGFALSGEPDTWQIPRIGHNLPFNADIGTVMNLGEEYRWNMRTLVYGFDESFRNYFGERGMDEVRKAMAILNALPPFSKMSTNLEEFSTDTRRLNNTASALGIIDLKSYTLAFMVEQLGLASPERYTWCLRDRVVFPTDIDYYVIMRNFEPVPGSVSNYRPSKYVNGVLYTYGVFELTTAGTDWADAVEFPVDPLALPFTSVASAADGLFGGGLALGQYFTGLTRDDVAGLRYLYRPQNLQIEGLAVTNAISSGGIPWLPVGGGSNYVDQALRPGVDKITFVEGKYDSAFGSFITITNTLTDYYVTNFHQIKQQIRRTLVQPDIIFTAGDLNATFSVGRTVSRINNDALNGQIVLAGPGVIAPPFFLTFNKVGPFLVNVDFTDPNVIDQMFEESALQGFVWGSFDGTTNAPIIYPEGASMEELENQVLH